MKDNFKMGEVQEKNWHSIYNLPSAGVTQRAATTLAFSISSK
jgi:hypothetical protein